MRVVLAIGPHGRVTRVRSPESLIPPSLLVDPGKLITAYFTGQPDPAIAAQRVAFGTSGHRGSAFTRSFNENHILAITQAICHYRDGKGIDGPLFVGIDTHALSSPALATALEVLAANGVDTMIDAGDWLHAHPGHLACHPDLQPRPQDGLADGIVITPSHNPPEDGGFKYNPPQWRPGRYRRHRLDRDAAPTSCSRKAWRACARGGRTGLRRANRPRHDYIAPYVADLANVIDMEAIRASAEDRRRSAGRRGGAFLGAHRRRVRHRPTTVNDTVDPTFGFMTVDWDGKIRMDCSSPYAMTRLIALRKDDFDIAFANDTDADRHGIVTRTAG